MTISYQTIGDLLNAGATMNVGCRTWRCDGYGEVNLEMLAEKLGRDHSCLADELVKRFRCSACGQKNASFILDFPHMPGSTVGKKVRSEPPRRSTQDQ